MERYTPIAYDILFRGIRDKGPETDEKSPYVRNLINFDVDGESAKPRAGLKALSALPTNEDILEVFTRENVFGTDYVYAFTEDYVYRATYTNGVIGTFTGSNNVPIESGVSISEYPEIDGGGIGIYNVTVQGDNYVTDVAANFAINEHVGRILDINSAASHREYRMITSNTSDTIFVADTIEGDFSSAGNFTAWDTRDVMYFNSGGDIWFENAIGDMRKSVANTDEINVDYMIEYAGRLFVADNEKSRIYFSAFGTVYFPNNNYIIFDKSDGEFRGFKNYLNSLVVMMEHGIYTINGREESGFSPQRVMSEVVNIRTNQSYAVKNNAMFFLSDRGLESMAFPNLRTTPEAKPVSSVLDIGRFSDDNVDTYSDMTIIGNRVITQMADYMLVYDVDMSESLETRWFGEYRGFNFRCADEIYTTPLLCSGNTVYTLDDSYTSDDNHSLIECTVEGNILEYAQRTMKKLYRDVVFYQTWNQTGGTMEFSSSGRNVPELVETRTDAVAGLTDEEQFYCQMESPYLKWKLKMTGDFTLEDIIFFLLPSRKLYAGSSIT